MAEKECVLYSRRNSSVRCSACAHRCLIAEGRTGICGVRKNVGGKLYLLVYGKIIAKHVDPIEKKPLYHFLPKTYTFSIATIGCNFQCAFCQNFDISQFKEFHSELAGEEILPEEVVAQAIKSKCKSIAYTYNEPTIFIEFVYDTAIIAKQKGLKNVLVTNGFMTKEALEYVAQYIDAMNIDLKSFSDNFYMRICKARLKPVLETIRRAHKKGIHIEITTLLVPDENDSKEELEKIAKFIASIDQRIPWHISRFFPHYQMQYKPPTPIEKLRQAKKIGEKYLKYVYLGNI